MKLIHSSGIKTSMLSIQFVASVWQQIIVADGKQWIKVMSTPIYLPDKNQLL